MRFIKILETNIRNVLRRTDAELTVRRQWDKIIVNPADTLPESIELLATQLGKIPGITHSLQVNEYPFTDMDEIYRHTLAVFGDQLQDKTFCVRVKRSGQHEFNSMEVERYVGGGLNQFTQAAGVKLKHPDITINLEIDRDKLYLVERRIKGLGGFPIATQEDVLSLISGGFDSGVSSYQCIKKGARTHYCFFNLGGAQHEIGVKQVAYHLWSTYGSSHKVKFITVPFEAAVTEILERIDNGQMGVILKRLMMRVGAAIAERMGIQALVTGESLGQVSSQTLTNLNVIDRVTPLLILRPLVAMDKQDIINISRHIGTEEFAKTIPEYCGVISKKPTVKAVLSKVESEEEKFSEDLLERILADIEVMDIRDIAIQTESQVEETHSASAVDEQGHDVVVLDIRSPEEQESAPLELDGTQVIHIPFYKLATQMAALSKDNSYLLYCDRGVMSKLQALYLQEQGYTNVKVYQP